MQEGDEISMTDMAQLIAVDSEEDEEDDPDYEPLSMEEGQHPSTRDGELLHMCKPGMLPAHVHIMPDLQRLCLVS